MAKVHLGTENVKGDFWACALIIPPTPELTEQTHTAICALGWGGLTW